MMTQVRRIITGHDENHRAIFVADEPNPHVLPAKEGVVVQELWTHDGAPDNAASFVDPVGSSVVIPPPRGGSVLRIVEFPPGRTEPPFLHRTDSLDYCVVLDGEVVAVLDDEADRTMRVGDVLIQRGTNHAWVNRSSATVRVLFVLIDAPGLAVFAGESR